jgi:hypothetical protein
MDKLITGPCFLMLLKISRLISWSCNIVTNRGRLPPFKQKQTTLIPDQVNLLIDTNGVSEIDRPVERPFGFLLIDTHHQQTDLPGQFPSRASTTEMSLRKK